MSVTGLTDGIFKVLPHLTVAHPLTVAPMVASVLGNIALIHVHLPIRVIKQIPVIQLALIIVVALVTPTPIVAAILNVVRLVPKNQVHVVSRGLA